jgi:uncharacterized protein YndB with AHSA1/START domain
MPEKNFTLSLQDGTFIQRPGSVGVHFERILDHPVPAVWQALTQPQQLAHWLAPATIVPGPGGSITLQLTGGTMGGKITKWKENILLEYAWHNGSTVRWELLHEGKDRTRLLFTHCHVTERQLIDAAKGWHYHLDMLALTLEGKKGPAHPVEIWDDITREANQRYKAALGNPSEPVDPFVIERVYNAPVSSVWEALTDKEALKQWSFDIPDFEPLEDYEFTFKGENESRVYVHFCRITEVVERRRLSYSWRYENVNGISHVTWELFPEGGGTRLRLTHEGLERFAHAGPDFARSNFVGGWGYYFDKALSAYLEKAFAAVAQ